VYRLALSDKRYIIRRVPLLSRKRERGEGWERHASTQVTIPSGSPRGGLLSSSFFDIFPGAGRSRFLSNYLPSTARASDTRYRLQIAIPRIAFPRIIIIIISRTICMDMYIYIYIYVYNIHIYCILYIHIVYIYMYTKDTNWIRKEFLNEFFFPRGFPLWLLGMRERANQSRRSREMRATSAGY